MTTSARAAAVANHPTVLGLFKCDFPRGCGSPWNGPIGSKGTQGCPYCGSIYFTWVNYERFVR